MTDLKSRIETRARRAYEAGRLGASAFRALALAPLVALSLLCCATPWQVLACGGALLVVVTLLLWRGQEYGAGVGPGIAAGLLPLLMPVVTHIGGRLCDAGSCLLVPGVCALGGVAGGVLLGLIAPRPRAGHLVPFITACGVAGLTGAVGCLMYGLIGLAVMAAGIAVGAVPLIATRRA